jgi:hypothetical protein
MVGMPSVDDVARRWRQVINIGLLRRGCGLFAD